MDVFVDAGQLEEVPLLRGLDRPELERIAEHAVKIFVRPGIKLIKQGEAGFDFSIVLSGTADVRVDDVTVATLGPGDVFGEMALVGTGKRNADVVATSAMVLATMMVWDFRNLTQSHPLVAGRLEEIIAARRGS
jgi:CRP-like cAMP-binding protein